MEHMTAEQYRKLTGMGNKYHNRKTEIDGMLFDSLAEANRYLELKLLREAGEIQGFTCQPSFVLGKGIRYRPDFMVKGKDGNCWVEDVKGFETKEFKLKKRLWEQAFPWLELKILK